MDDLRYPIGKFEFPARFSEKECAAWISVIENTPRAPIEMSVRLLEALHARWTVFLRNMSPGDVSRMFQHPDSGSVPLGGNIALYAWHGRHHVAHITRLREREGWA